MLRKTGDRRVQQVGTNWTHTRVTARREGKIDVPLALLRPGSLLCCSRHMDHRQTLMQLMTRGFLNVFAEGWRRPLTSHGNDTLPVLTAVAFYLCPCPADLAVWSFVSLDAFS